MQLVLIRHADAGDPGAAWPDDDQRPLTKTGQSQSVSIGNSLGKLIPEVDLFCSSPLLRAKQTAALICESSGWRSPVIHNVSPFAPIDEVMRGFENYGVDVLAYVGHEPTLSLLITSLLAPHETQPIVEMKKAAYALLKTDGRSAVLSWLVIPRAL